MLTLLEHVKQQRKALIHLIFQSNKAFWKNLSLTIFPDRHEYTHHYMETWIYHWGCQTSVKFCAIIKARVAPQPFVNIRLVTSNYLVYVNSTLVGQWCFDNMLVIVEMTTDMLQCFGHDPSGSFLLQYLHRLFMGHPINLLVNI